MAILHKNVTETDLHENKGVSTATNHFVATASAGATVWKLLTTDNFNPASIFRLNKFILQVHIPSNATASNHRVVVPVAATVDKVSSVLGGTISVADNTITVKNAAGSSMGTLTIAQSGSAAGDVDTLVPGSNNTFTAGTVLLIENAGTATGAEPLDIVIELTQTA